jgi:hypothetical protein
MALEHRARRGAIGTVVEVGDLWVQQKQVLERRYHGRLLRAMRKKEEGRQGMEP